MDTGGSVDTLLAGGSGPSRRPKPFGARGEKMTIPARFPVDSRPATLDTMRLAIESMLRKKVKAVMKTYMARKGEVPVQWHVVDVSDKILGRICTRIATILMGKHRPEYTPHVDTGDFVIVLNAAKVRVTGNSKPQQRVYQRYSGYPGGRKAVPLETMMERHPDRVVREAVRRMLPKSKLGKAMLSKLKVYAGSEHPHQAQKPETLDL